MSLIRKLVSGISGYCWFYIIAIAMIDAWMWYTKWALITLIEVAVIDCVLAVLVWHPPGE